ncbi:MAG: hypothetical protein JWQ89_3225 [Devosia sp.]|uniref:hypothetical protein n=1 Tax=Devosia sp. TaxID=1871048 RepID=UPI0026084EFE|nr:hypothetical protein [Devosia sp.]MDB5541498.1 hypothetical protein [Devosia sp.]
MIVKSNLMMFVASALMVAGISATPAGAGGLLGGLTDTVSDLTDTVTETVTDTVGDLTGAGGDGTNVGGLATINDPDNAGLVNVDIGGGNNVLNASVGGGNKPLANVGLTTTGLLKSTAVTLDLAGLGLDLTVDFGTLGTGGGGNGNGNPPPGGGNGPGNGPGRGYVLVGSLGGSSFVINCAANNARQLLQVAAAGKINAAEIKAWMRAANVQVVPIKLCPAAKKQVAQILSRSQKINLLRRAVMSDALISASLGRTRYDAGDVVAVQRKGGQLVVYVF